MLWRRLAGTVSWSAALAIAVACSSTPAAPTAAPPAPGTPPAACTPAPGVVCFGQNNWIEYVAGDLPIVISAPHGGTLDPPTIPNRTGGTSATDLNTVELARAVADAFRARVGRAPHVVICHLRRTKLDANREIGEAAEGQPAMMNAWVEYHGFIDLALTDVLRSGGPGLYIDLHGHGHSIQRLELGYLLTAATLDLNDGLLIASGAASTSSLRIAMASTPDSFAELVRGPSSLGGLLASSYPSVPSPAAPSPGTDPYFSGGYSTERHSARMPGLQIEANFVSVRDSAASRAAFAGALAGAIQAFYQRHLGAGIL